MTSRQRLTSEDWQRASGQTVELDKGGQASALHACRSLSQKFSAAMSALRILANRIRRRYFPRAEEIFRATRRQSRQTPSIHYTIKYQIFRSDLAVLKRGARMRRQDLSAFILDSALWEAKAVLHHRQRIV